MPTNTASLRDIDKIWLFTKFQLPQESGETPVKVNVYCFSVVLLLLPSSQRSVSVTNPGAWDWGSRLRACLYLWSFLSYGVFRQTFALGWLRVSLCRRALSQLSQAVSKSDICRHPVMLTESLLKMWLQWGKLRSQGTSSNFLLAS